MAEAMSVQSKTRLIMTKSQLKNFHCSFCRKLLSVKPINRADKGTSCGRCIKDEVVDNVSSNNMLVEEYVFPCINIYEGCNKLLRPEEVEEHEARCPDDDWPCRNCSGEFFPLHEQLIHYQEQHSERLLESTIFMVDLSVMPPFGKWCFLHEHRTTLFHIRIEKMERDGPYYWVYAEHLGKMDQRFKQRFVFCYGDRRFSSVGSSTSPDSLTVKRNLQPFWFGGENLVAVSFYLNGPVYKGITTNPDKIITKRNASLIASNWDFTEAQLIAPKKLWLQKLSHWFSLKPGSSLDYFLVPPFVRKFYPHCFRCGEMDYTTYWLEGTKFVHFYVVGDTSYMLCSICKRIPGTPAPAFRPASLQFPITAFKGFKLFCMWNCTWLSDTAEEAFTHHIGCEGQPVRHCPEESCDFVGKLPSMTKHFENQHDSIYFVLTSAVTTMFSWRLEKKFYFLVRNAFVRGEVKCSEGVWRAQFSLCGDKPIFAGKKLKISVFDVNERTYLDSCIPPQEMTMMPHKKLLIKGYLI